MLALSDGQVAVLVGVALGALLLAIIALSLIAGRRRVKPADVEARCERLRERGPVRLELDDVRVRYLSHLFVSMRFRSFRARLILQDEALYLVPTSGPFASVIAISWASGAWPHAIGFELRSIESGADWVSLRCREGLMRVRFRIRTPEATKLAAELARLSG